MRDVESFLPAMVEAVRAAARICLAVRAELAKGDSVRKDDRSPVTVADLACQAVVARRLRDLFPGVPLAAEEDSSVLAGEERRALCETVLARVRAEWPGASESDVLAAIDLGGGPGGRAGRFFTLDPIDGTKGFLRGDQYAVALALIDEGRVVAGVLGCPALPRPGGEVGAPALVGAVIAAVRGGGSRQLALDGTDLRGEPLRVSGESDPARLRLCESVEVGHSDRAASTALLARLGSGAPPVRLDSQCKYAVLARGEAELYLRSPTRADRPEWVWDHAAGSLVVEEAGGRVTDLDGRTLDFGRGRALAGNRGIVATNGRLHDAVLAALP